jgi:hypothetical protein
VAVQVVHSFLFLLPLGGKVEKDREKENIDLQSGGEMSHGKDYGASKNLLIALYGERFGSLPTPI